MLLAIDVGNTHITIGAYKGKTLTQTWRLSTNRHATSDELGLHLLGLLDHPEGIIIASVVPSMDDPLRAACETYLKRKPLFVSSKLNIGIKNLYRNPEEVGADRLVNAVAVYAFYKKAAIVVDFGTATTLDCVTSKGEYLGGAICPGMELAGEWLATHTAKLPRVTFEGMPSGMQARPVIGKTTIESLQSGLFWGYIALVEGLLARMKKEMGGQPKIVATGGLSTLLGPHLKSVSEILPNLTLDGLRMIWERQRT